MAYKYKRIKWQTGMFESPDPHSGTVLEHREIVSRLLGRKLKPQECVHHRDENKLNNSIDNLIVFATGGDHAAHHAGADLIPLEDGTFKSERKLRTKSIRTKKDPVPIICYCGNIKNREAKVCLDCYLSQKSSHIPSEKELSRLLWKIPTSHIAKIYNVSDTAIKKWCKKYNLSKPPRGYWAKTRVSAGDGEPE